MQEQQNEASVSDTVVLVSHQLTPARQLLKGHGQLEMADPGLRWQPSWRRLRYKRLSSFQQKQEGIGGELQVTTSFPAAVIPTTIFTVNAASKPQQHISPSVPTLQVSSSSTMRNLDWLLS